MVNTNYTLRGHSNQKFRVRLGNICRYILQMFNIANIQRCTTTKALQLAIAKKSHSLYCNILRASP